MKSPIFQRLWNSTIFAKEEGGHFCGFSALPDQRASRSDTVSVQLGQYDSDRMATRASKEILAQKVVFLALEN